MSSTICSVEPEVATVQPISCASVAKVTWRVVLPVLAVVVGIAGIQAWESWRGDSLGATTGNFSFHGVLNIGSALVFVGMGISFYVLERREFRRIEVMNQDAAILFEAREPTYRALLGDDFTCG